MPPARDALTEGEFPPKQRTECFTFPEVARKGPYELPSTGTLQTFNVEEMKYVGLLIE